MASPTNPRELLLRFRVQANSKLTVYAPNGDAYVIDAGERANVARQLGETVLEVFADPGQPAATIEQDGRTSSAEPVSSSSSSSSADPADQREHAFRGFLNSLFPGAEKALDFLQDVSAPEKPKGKG